MPEVINFIHDIVVNKYHKKYTPRTWALGNKNWGANADNYTDVIKHVSASNDIVFSVKNTRTDFWRYNHFNPVLGTGDKEQAIEILCQDSYHFKTAIPYYEVIRMARGAFEFDENLGLKKAYETGVRSAWGWLTADGWCGPYIEREEWLSANIYGFSHLAWQVDRDPETLAREWAAIDFEVILPILPPKRWRKY